MVNEAKRPTRGSTPAMMEKEIASGISARATTRPPRTSIRRRRGERSAARTDCCCRGVGALVVAGMDGLRSGECWCKKRGRRRIRAWSAPGSQVHRAGAPARARPAADPRPSGRPRPTVRLLCTERPPAADYPAAADCPSVADGPLAVARAVPVPASQAPERRRKQYLNEKGELPSGEPMAADLSREPVGVRHTDMVDVWIWPAYVGVLLGVTLFAVIFVPTLIVQTRRYGAPSLRRLIGTAAVAVYGVALVAYTLLPLPSGDLVQWCAAHGVGRAQLTPLQFLADIRRETAGLGLRATLMSRSVLQVVLNVALFVPLGALLRRYAGRGILTSTLAAFAVSLLIELTQYTGVWGLIGCSYRVADVDDLIANTFGGLLGAVLAPVF